MLRTPRNLGERWPGETCQGKVALGTRRVPPSVLPPAPASVPIPKLSQGGHLSGPPRGKVTAAAAGLTREPCARAPREGVAQAEVRRLLRGVSLPPGVSRPGVGARKGQDGCGSSDS